MRTIRKSKTLLMRHPGRNVLILALLLALVEAGGCKASSAPTAPGSGGGTRFNLGPFAIGQSAELTFADAGTIGYHCNAHRNMGMVGTVQVDSAGADSTVVQIGATGFSFIPATAHIKPGGHVRWVNASGLTNHTVTSD